MVIPAGGADPGAVAGGVRQAAICPRHPGQGGFHLRQASQQAIVGDGGRQGLQSGDMPGAADHGDPPVAVLDGLAQHLPHVRLADRVARVRFARVRAQDPDGLGQGLEDRRTGDVLHHVLPPALGIVVASGPGQLGDGIDVRPRSRRVGHRELVGGREVAEPDRDASLDRVPDRLPLRREHRERPERRRLRFPGHVAEQRYRRLQARIRRQLDQPIGLRRPLDQHDVRSLFPQGRSHRPRRPRPVMPDPVQLGHPATSRQAR